MEQPHERIEDEHKKLRFQFALKSLNHIKNQRLQRDFLFSPYILHETLMMVYFASSGDTEEQLRNILHISENYTKSDWIAYYAKEIKKVDREQINGYYEQNICLIDKNKTIKEVLSDLFNANKRFELDFNFKQQINKVLREENCLPQNTYLNRIDKKVQFILLSVLRFGDRFQQCLKTIRTDSSTSRASNRTVISPDLHMFVTELPFLNKSDQSLYILFSAEKIPSQADTWRINKNIDILIYVLSNAGANKLRNILDNTMPSTEETIEGTVICPNTFKMEQELAYPLMKHLGIQKILESDETKLNDFTHENLSLGRYVHRAYISMTEENVTAGAINMFLTKNKNTAFDPFNPCTDNIQQKHSFIWLIYDKIRSAILHIGVKYKNSELELDSPTLRIRPSV